MINEMLQWSHGRLTVVTTTTTATIAAAAMLQWSHGRLTVVTHLEKGFTVMGDGASMEPRSFNRGDGPDRSGNLGYVSLQWSHGRLTVVTCPIFGV